MKQKLQDKQVCEKNFCASCPFCPDGQAELYCPSCYSEVNKETCWKYRDYCQKCFEFVEKVIPKLKKLKHDLGVKCKCMGLNCSRCLLGGCKEENCPVHTRELKNARKIK